MSNNIINGQPVEPVQDAPNDARVLNTDVNVHSTASQPLDDIVSVNKKGTDENKVAKAVFILVVGSVLVGGVAWFSQNWLNNRKAQMRASTAPKTQVDNARVFNPEKTGSVAPKPKLGSESGQPPPSTIIPSGPQPGVTGQDGVRALRGADGKVMVNAQGEAMGVDTQGNVVSVPAITITGGEDVGRKPLPGQSAQPQGAQPSQQQQKPPSRYGGSLFVGEPPKSSAAREPTPAGKDAIALEQERQIADILRGSGLGGAQTPRAGATPPTPSSTATPYFGQPAGATLAQPVDQVRPGTVGSTLFSSATPVAAAKRLSDQNLILPKGRQADCTLTSRIVDEVPGFTSCVLAQNLYSDNGRVLLLERGSELTGEYGTTNQLGLERLFVTWTRLKTPEGIEIDISSPGADQLGTSGHPGHLDNRWGARIGAAFLLSFVKDVTVALINKQNKPESGSTLTVQSAPGQNTLNASSSLVEEVIKQTIKVRPRLSINEGDRISIYVARDLDFTPVYALKTAGTLGGARPLSP